jgi:hypothetical protein
MRDALGNDGVYGLNILSLFLYWEVLPQWRFTFLGCECQQRLKDLGDNWNH